MPFKLAVAAALAAGLAAGQGAAQEQGSGTSADSMPGVVEEAVVDTQFLLDNSDFWKRVLAERGVALRMLAAESKKYDLLFKEEEEHLAEIKPNLPRGEFRAMADDFNYRVDERRGIQDGKQARISDWVDIQAQMFFAEAYRLAGEYAGNRGIKLIVPSNALIWYDNSIDITQQVLQETNRRIGTGTGLQGFVSAIDYVGLEAEGSN